MRKTFLTYYIFLFLLLTFNTGVLSAQAKIDIVKTAYIGKFANYIQWPEFDNDNKVFRILVIGDQDLCSILENAFSERKLQNKPVEVICKGDNIEIKEIDLLLLSGSKIKDFENALDFCKTKKCLLVTSADNFAKKGAHINFYLTSEETLHFEINKSRMDEDGFEVDFLLLDFAKVIK